MNPKPNPSLLSLEKGGREKTRHGRGRWRDTREEEEGGKQHAQERGRKKMMCGRKKRWSGRRLVPLNELLAAVKHFFKTSSELNSSQQSN